MMANKAEPFAPNMTEFLARHIIELACNLYGSTLRGQQCGKDRETQREMTDLRYGDLIVEQTAGRMAAAGKYTEAANCVGILEEVAWEPVQFSDPDFVWDEKAEGTPHPTERIVYIRTLKGIRFRWHNASFIRVPSSAECYDHGRELKPSFKGGF